VGWGVPGVIWLSEEFTTYLQSMVKLGMGGGISPLPLSAFVARRGTIINSFY